jgi:hypothetical protein
MKKYDQEPLQGESCIDWNLCGALNQGAVVDEMVWHLKLLISKV